MKRGDVLKLKIEDYAFEGKGVARVPLEEGEKNFVIFVHGAYPGEVVEAMITRKKKNFAEAKLQKILVSAPFRTVAKCQYFGVCGGCRQQDLQYEKQLEFKKAQVLEAFRRIAGLDDFEVEEILPSEKIYGYRNKMEFSFSDKRWLTKEEIEANAEIKNRNFALGLHIPKMFDKVLDIKECFLQSPVGNEILNFTREFFLKRDIPPYSTRTHSGFLRNLVIKQSARTNDLMVNLVTAGSDEILMKEYTEALLSNVKGITTVFNNVNLKKSQTAYGDYERIYYGKGFIYDYIGDYKFRISANSFFQTNTLQAERLYNTVLRFASFRGDEIVYDLYAGAGTITIFISKYVKEVIGLETAESSIADAAVNAELNDVSNMRFFSADLNKSFLHVIESNNLSLPDIVVLDPPRSGMNPRTVKDIVKLAPRRIVYVSCNPTTQARDIRLLVDSGYRLFKIRPVDMFPHTYHIENVALLGKRD